MINKLCNDTINYIFTFIKSNELLNLITIKFVNNYLNNYLLNMSNIYSNLLDDSFTKIYNEIYHTNPSILIKYISIKLNIYFNDFFYLKKANCYIFTEINSSGYFININNTVNTILIYQYYLKIILIKYKSSITPKADIDLLGPVITPKADIDLLGPVIIYPNHSDEAITNINYIYDYISMLPIYADELGALFLNIDSKNKNYNRIFYILYNYEINLFICNYTCLTYEKIKKIYVHWRYNKFPIELRAIQYIKSNISFTYHISHFDFYKENSNIFLQKMNEYKYQDNYKIYKRLYKNIKFGLLII